MKPTSILFVCLGNICRSPMAEGVFLTVLHREGVSGKFKIDSAGTMGYHQGELADRRMRFHAEKRGYNLTHLSRPVKPADFEQFDLIIAMDNQNVEDLEFMAQTSIHRAKIRKMTDFCRRFNDYEIPDPYYGGDSGFDHVIDLLEDGCEGLFAELKKII
jgi:protein-tyrosine phosphatase